MQKLARTEDQRSASSCFQFILAWLDAFPLLLSSLMAKHRSNRLTTLLYEARNPIFCFSEAIKTQMQKWRGHGFDGPLNTLNGYIATGVVAESHDQVCEIDRYGFFAKADMSPFSDYTKPQLESKLRTELIG